MEPQGHLRSPKEPQRALRNKNPHTFKFYPIRVSKVFRRQLSLDSSGLQALVRVAQFVEDREQKS